MKVEANDVVRLEVEDFRQSRRHDVVASTVVNDAKLFAEKFWLSVRSFPFITRLVLRCDDGLVEMIVHTMLFDRDRQALRDPGQRRLVVFTHGMVYEMGFPSLEKIIRRALLEVMSHEVDESIYLEEVRPFDPHRGEFTVAF